MTVNDLGELTGDVLLFGGPYSNLQAFDALVEVSRARGIPASRMICTGDVCAYGADPHETTAAVMALGCPVVAGNCEEQLGSGAPDCGCGFEEGTACNIASGQWYAHASAALSKDQTAWMRAVPSRVVFTHLGRRYAVIHGGARDVSCFIWPSDAASLKLEEIAALEAELGPVDAVICGHSGIGFIERLATSSGDRLWINAGVIGMPPHDGDPRTEYAILGDDGPSLHRLAYDHDAAASAMVAARLTLGYERGVTCGWWPSEDVLPPAMTLGITAFSAPEDDGRTPAS